MRVYTGWTMAMRGNPKAAIEEIRSGMENFIGTQSGIYVPTMWLMLSDALRLDGQLGEALTAVERGLALGRQFDEGYYRAELLRARAELQISLGDAGAGEETLRESIAVARTQGAKFLELRAALVLARLIAARGDRTEALALLSPLDDWFTQGRDTPELLELRRVLTDLGRTGVVGGASATI
jgi:predicted ATPase